MMDADGYYIYTGREGEIIPLGVTRVRIDESVSVIPARAFQFRRSIEEVECHDRVKTVEEGAFNGCLSLRRVIMRGVEVVEGWAFSCCKALEIVECDKLERIEESAFNGCESLTSINLPSAEIVEGCAFWNCRALMNVKFGEELESIERLAFRNCTSLERITIPLKDGMITHDSIFRWCENLIHIDLVGGGRVHEIIDALLWEEWKNDVNEEINAINQILPTVYGEDTGDDMGGKALAIRMWIRSVLRKIIQYKAQHFSVLEEAATTLKLTLPQDIVIKNVLPFLELPSFTFEVGDHEDEEDDSEEEEGDDESSY